MLHTLELLSNRVRGIDLALVTSVEELGSSSVVLRGSIRNFILKELLLGLLEGRVFLQILRHGSHGILATATLARSLVQLVVAQLGHFMIIIGDAVEGRVRLHHVLLLVLGKLFKATRGGLLSAHRLDAHLLGASLRKGGLGGSLTGLVLLL